MALILVLPAAACSVPVFRYALEHWKADAYQAIVFHRGALTAAHARLARSLGKDGLAGELHANLSVQTVDLDGDVTPGLLSLSREATALPWLVVRAPLANRVPATVHSGPLDADTLKPLLESPARREITRRLADGQSAVWLLLESGDRDKDAAAAGLIESRLAFLGSNLHLPKLEAQDIANGLVSLPADGLRLEFSLLRLSRTDPAERVFVQSLLGTEHDLAAVREPVVFPVFGRGRALYALVGAGIRRETVDQAAQFLIGKCSCQVKDQNPGADLLFAANWDRLIKSQTNALPDLPSLAELAKSAPVTVTISADTILTGNEATAAHSQPAPTTWLVVGALVTLAFAFAAFFRGRT